jgi:hypothetical protein
MPEDVPGALDGVQAAVSDALVQDARVLRWDERVAGAGDDEGRGDLYAGTDDSALVEGERLRASYLVMLGRLADIARRDHDYSSALEYASLVLKYDAAREDAHRTLMRCYALLGERVQAMRQYLLCERLLRETFDAVPEPARESSMIDSVSHPQTFSMKCDPAPNGGCPGIMLSPTRISDSYPNPAPRLSLACRHSLRPVPAHVSRSRQSFSCPC